MLPIEWQSLAFSLDSSTCPGCGHPAAPAPYCSRIDGRRGAMPSMEALPLPGFDAATGTLMLPWWVAAAVSAILVVILVAMVRRSATVVGGLAAVAGLALIVAFAGIWMNRSVEREHSDDRRALAARAQELTVLAATPG